MVKNSYPKGRQAAPEALERIRQLLGDGDRDRGLLIEYLHLIQDAEGHIPAALLAALADDMKLSQAEVYEVATFYAHFNVTGEDETPPPPLTVRACGGIACQMAGAKELIEALSQGLGDKVRVIEAPCMGACDSAPAATLGLNRIGDASPEKISAAVDRGQTAANPTDDAQLLDAYLGRGGYDVLQSCRSGERSRDSVLDEIEGSGLCGLGGAGFPVARKWRFLADTPKPRALVVNADEGEPGTFKDRHCLETDPHRVLEGALIAAWTVEADDIYIYLRDEYPHIRQRLAHELAKLNDGGLLGDVTVHLRRGAGAYICGEESALLESLEGKRGLPRNRPPFPAEAGLFGRPTLINNVETLFWLPEVLQKGAGWYQGEGRPHFYSLSGRIKQPGVKLAPSGISVVELIENHGGGMADGHTFKAYLPGGASGGILPASKGDLPLDFGSLAEYGCFIGSAAVVVLSDRDDLGDVVRNLLRFFEDESCGQCTPCRAGCEKLLQLLDAPKRDEALIRDLAEAMGDASICGLGQAAANPLISAMNFLNGDLT